MILERREGYYFSTHGCSRLSCAGAEDLEELACAAAAAWRARMSKKLAIAPTLRECGKAVAIS